MNHSHRPAVVITGYGVISPLGNTVDEYWANLVAGRSGISRLQLFDPSPYPTQIAGEVKNFEPGDYMDRKEARRMGRFSQFAIAGARLALEDAGLGNGFEDPERVGIILGNSSGGYDVSYNNISALLQGGWKRVNPFAIPASLPNLASHHISHLFGTLGPISTISTACASSTQAMIDAAHLLQRGTVDVVISGGVEACINQATHAGFCAMRGMSTRNENPEAAVRPFEKDRDGFLLAEGAAIFIMETEERARARGAHIHCRVLGGAASSDAFHMAQPDPEGKGAVRAMRWAVQDAGLSLDDIDYINAHGPGTPLGDTIETRAIKTLFGERAYEIPVSSTKSMIGHAMGAAGAMEALACVKTLETQTIHPTINYDTPDPECDLDYVPEGHRPARVRTILSNSFGLGGQNACLVLGVVNGASN
jgi:3-oxoacyl-[acyl-carrier-protein] synthase II